jgi:hypothetical protein
MKTEVTKTLYDGQKFTELGSYTSLEAAHSEHKHYQYQHTFDEIEEMDKGIPYLHLIEYRDDEHYNDLYFTWRGSK